MSQSFYPAEVHELPQFGFDALVAWIQGNLQTRFGFSAGQMPEFVQSPVSIDGIPDTVYPTVWLIMGGGPGYTREKMFDSQMIDLECAGPPDDNRAAADLARALDLVLQFDTPQYLPIPNSSDTVYALNCQRAGGPPNNAGIDSTGRLHLYCGYVIQIETRL